MERSTHLAALNPKRGLVSPHVMTIKHRRYEIGPLTVDYEVCGQAPPIAATLCHGVAHITFNARTIVIEFARQPIADGLGKRHGGFIVQEGTGL
jgi:hypothetical protein